MTFLSGTEPVLTGEGRMPGHHNYFLGNEKKRWRTHVPRFSSVRYSQMYSGIDVHLRQEQGHFEYDLLGERGVDFSQVIVKVSGADQLSLAENGSLVIATALGSIVQPKPDTWETRPDGSKLPVECAFVLLGDDCFGFSVKDRSGRNAIVIDPGILWSTYLGGASGEAAFGVATNDAGIVTIVGRTWMPGFPVTVGAYDTSYNTAMGAEGDAFVSRLDPSKVGSAQLIYSSFLGGTKFDSAEGPLHVSDSGIVTLAGRTQSSDFPTSVNAFDSSYNGDGVNEPKGDVFVTRLDPSKVGSGQLVYSTFFGGDGHDFVGDIAVIGDVVTIVGETGLSVNPLFPTTAGAYDTTHNGDADGFVSALDISKVANQLIYSTYLGGTGFDFVSRVDVNAGGVLTVAGWTKSTDLPQVNPYDASYNGDFDAFVGRLDPGRVISGNPLDQLIYSTYLGGTAIELSFAVSADDGGVVTVVGQTGSSDFPTTNGAFDRTYNDIVTLTRDTFVGRLDPTKVGSAQLTYSTFLGGSANEAARAAFVDESGVVVVTGDTESTDFPTTSGAVQKTRKGIPTLPRDAFLSRLDPARISTGNPPDQLIYSTYLGGGGNDFSTAISVNTRGLVTIAGGTDSPDFPTTNGSYDSSYNSGQPSAPFGSQGDAYVAQIEIPPYYVTVGQGCGTATRKQVMTLDRPPRLGETLTVLGSGLDTGSNLVFVAVGTPATPQVPIRAGCFAFQNEFLPLAIGTTQNSTWTAQVSIPRDPKLANLGLTLQAVILDAAKPTFELSNGVHMTFGY